MKLDELKPNKYTYIGYIDYLIMFMDIDILYKNLNKRPQSMSAFLSMMDPKTTT